MSSVKQDLAHASTLPTAAGAFTQRTDGRIRILVDAEPTQRCSYYVSSSCHWGRARHTALLPFPEWAELVPISGLFLLLPLSGMLIPQCLERLALLTTTPI